MESADSIKHNEVRPIYAKEGFTLYNEDNLKVMQTIPSNSVDMVFADPPYMISKADWDISRGFEGDMNFHERWITECRRILKPEGTIWITGTHHSIYQCGYLLQKSEFKILNDISWYKPHKKREIFTRVFVPAHETVLWARKDKNATHYFNHYAMSGQYFQDILRKKDEQMHTVWSIMPRMDAERMQGTHPTQKPVALLRRIVLASTKPGDTIFDPFNGGGTTGIAVASLGKRKYIGCDLSKEYIDLTIRRYEALNRNTLPKDRGQKATDFILDIKNKLEQADEKDRRHEQSVEDKNMELDEIRKKVKEKNINRGR